jgi:hypothetical protein
VTLRYRKMNHLDALYTLARSYPGGIEALAQRMSGARVMSPNVLRNKLRPNIDTHHVTSEEESLIMELCEEAGVKDPHAPLIAKNWRHGLIAFPVPTVDDISDTELTQSVCRAMKEFSDLSAAASHALADNRITLAELDEIEKEAAEALAAVAELKERMRMRAEADSQRGRTGEAA